MALRVFVAMPFKVMDGVDFNGVYAAFIRPGLTDAGFDVFRADDEMRAGNIRADMFQELLMADLVVADVSTHNPNVWYELGVRHALRSGGVMLIRCRDEDSPFDIYTDRKLFYHVKDGKPDPEFLVADKDNLATMARETVERHPFRKVSPVYHHLPCLREPEWRSLLIREKGALQARFETWDRLLATACRKKRPGDILVLGGEAPVQALRLEAVKKAGQALMKLGQYEFAMEQVETVLGLNPEDLESRHAKGIILGRMGLHEEAAEWLKRVAGDEPECAETLALVGRVEKDAWTAAWRVEGNDIPTLIEDAKENAYLLDEAIDAYESGFRKDPSHYYSGINAFALLHLRNRLMDRDGDGDKLYAMEGGLRWAIHCDLKKETMTDKNYWARTTLGDLELLAGDKTTMIAAYQRALAVAKGDWFSVDSTFQQLKLYRDLGVRPDQVGAAMALVEKTLSKLSSPVQQGQVFLFSGHMIDAPDRIESRFPPEKEAAAKTAIATILDNLNAGPGDLGLCGGACGGDLLFAEACLALEKKVKLQVRIPFKAPEFLKNSVTFAGEAWRIRFQDVINDTGTELLIMPQELGDLPRAMNPYARNNLWQLYTAMSMGAGNIHFICLWDRKPGDGMGGTQHMHDEVEKRAGNGRIHIIDINTL